MVDQNAIVGDTTKKKGKRVRKMSDSEVITIMVLFHLKGYRCLKHFYIDHVCEHMKDDFPETLFYNRFIELQKNRYCPWRCSSEPFVQVNVRVCRSRTPRSSRPVIIKGRNRTRSSGIAAKGRGTMGWFFGFKLHIVINDRGEIIDFLITQGNVDDRQTLKDRSFHKKVFGKIFADLGYIGKDLFEQLFVDGIHLVTKIKKT